MKISELLENIKTISFIGNENCTIEKVTTLNYFSSEKNVLIWLNDENLFRCEELSFVTIIASEKILKHKFQATCNIIIVENPRLTFQKTLKLFYPEQEIKHFIGKNVVIDSSAQIDYPVYIGHNTIIERDCKIESYTYIGNNNSILSNTHVGKNVKIGNSCVIGGVGFGYIKNEQGSYEHISHNGGVIIESNVEIGNNVCIDKAVLGNTILRENVKVDNLVHIAHGACIGKNSLIIAHAMVAGSVKIGENVWVAPNVAISNKVEIGDNALLGLGAVVVKNVPENVVVVGNPAKEIRKV